MQKMGIKFSINTSRAAILLLMVDDCRKNYCRNIGDLMISRIAITSRIASPVSFEKFRMADVISFSFFVLMYIPV